MKRRAVLLTICVLGAVRASAGEIREFDLKTTAQLGRELFRVSQQPDRGATNAVRKRAKQMATAALKNRLFKIHYDYVVLDDPDHSGFLVYALATRPGEIVMGGHFRVTVSADGGNAERVDALSRSLLFCPKPPKGMEGQKPLTVSMSQIVSNRPLETSIYTSLHDSVIVSVGMVNDNARVWAFVGDKIFEMTPQMMKQMDEDAKKEKKK
jgi:hypothetical protein